MRIGFKLDFDFRGSPRYQELFSDRNAPAYLHTLGVRAVETPTMPDTDADALRMYARRCVTAGLRVSLHPYTEDRPCNPAFFDADGDNACRVFFEQTFTLAGEMARLQHAATVVNIHPAAVPPGQMGREQQLAQSIRFFTWARLWTEAHQPRVEPTAELQLHPDADEDIARIGDSYAELLALAEAGNVRVCWDFGHAVMNHRNYGAPLDPPARFAARVRHVHCHDVNNAGDHQPLVFGGAPWRAWLDQLRAAGFDGTVVLEVPPSHFLRAGGLQALERSIAALVEMER
jgi:sugar phosphate isomerase/epimerase